MRQRLLAPPLTKRRGAKKEEETDLKTVEVWLVKLLLDVAHRVRPEVDSNKTVKNWNTYQSSRPRSARLRCSDRSRVEVTWPEPKLSKTRQGPSFSFEKETNKQTNKQGIQKLIWMKWACNKFWRNCSNIHMNLWSNSGLGGFGFESSFTLLSFQARQFSGNARCQELRENWIS